MKKLSRIDVGFLVLLTIIWVFEFCLRKDLSSLGYLVVFMGSLYIGSFWSKLFNQIHEKLSNRNRLNI